MPIKEPVSVSLEVNYKVLATRSPTRKSGTETKIGNRNENQEREHFLYNKNNFEVLQS